MTAPTPAALDALAAWLLADEILYNRGPDYEPLRVPASTKRLEVEAALTALRAQVETLTADLYETRRLHGKHILDASSQISVLEADRDQWREAHTREYQARIATEVEQSAAVSARAAAEAALARATAQVTILTEAHSAASAMNRSAWEIAERNGAETNWEAFRKCLMHALETSHEALNLLNPRAALEQKQ